MLQVADPLPRPSVALADCFSARRECPLEGLEEQPCMPGLFQRLRDRLLLHSVRWASPLVACPTWIPACLVRSTFFS